MNNAEKAVYDYLSCVFNNDFSTQQQIMKRYGVSHYEFRKAYNKIRKERTDIFA